MVLKRRISDSDSVVLPPCKRIRLGSFCAGLGTDAFALTSILGNRGVPWQHVFAVERDLRCVQFLLDNHRGLKRYFLDCMEPGLVKKLPAANVIVGGFPCQPFSQQGNQKGCQDERSHPILVILKYVKMHLPDCVLLENVANLAGTHRATLDAIAGTLKSFKHQDGSCVYAVSWQLLSSAVFGGVPQARVRLYIVASKQTSTSSPFQWPDPIPCPKLYDTLDQTPKVASLQQALPPKSAKRIRKVVTDVLVKYGLKLGRPLEIEDLHGIIVNDGGVTGQYMKDVSMTITATRGAGGGFWLPQLGRRTTCQELFRLQGFQDGTYHINDKLTTGHMGRMVGNAFTKTVIERLLFRLLIAGGLLCHGGGAAVTNNGE